MADERTFYRSVAGVTHGMSHYSAGDVFVGDADLDAAYDVTGGKTIEGDVLYEKASKSDYQKFLTDRDLSLVDGAPRGIVGFEPAGEDSLVDTQIAEVKEDGEKVLLEADEQAAKPEEGDPIPPMNAEAERRLNAPSDEDEVAKVDNAEGSKGGAAAASVPGPTQTPASEDKAKTARRGSGSDGPVA